MKMNRLFVPAFGLALVLLGSVSEVLALDNYSTNSTDVWPAEGNGNCSDYFDNAVVREATTKDLFGDAVPGPGVEGATNPLDPDADPNEVITFTINAEATKITSFSASTRINAVILKSGRTINIFVEPAGGVIDDSMLALAGGQEISAVSFCYGVSYFEPEPEVLAACSLDGDLDGCESGEAFECDLEVTTSTVVMPDGTTEEQETGTKVNCCACNDTGATSCDPSLPLGTTGACEFAIKSFNQILFGLNGRVVCYQTDRGEKCYSY